MGRTVTARIVRFGLVVALGVSGCSSGTGVTVVEQRPDAVWADFVQAVNERDIETVEALLAPQVEWSWDCALLAVHLTSSGRDSTVAGIEDLMGRGVTLESTVVEVAGATVTAETLFLEPGLADALGGRPLLEQDVVTIRNGMIVSWSSTADRIAGDEE